MSDRFNEEPAAWLRCEFCHQLGCANPLAAPAWQPIETAPKDGTQVLLWVDGHVMLSRWYVHYLNGAPNPHRAPEWEQGEMYGGFGGYMGPLRPTHWMPLPQPPK
jgi:hypothetical protein